MCVVRLRFFLFCATARHSKSTRIWLRADFRHARTSMNGIWRAMPPTVVTHCMCELSRTAQRWHAEPLLLSFVVRTFPRIYCVHTEKKKNSCAKNIAFIFFHFVVLPHIRSHKFGDACVPYGHHTASCTHRVEMDLWLSVHSMRWTDNSTSYALEILCDLFGSRGGWDFADGDMLSVMVDKGHLRAIEQRHWPIWLMWHGESKRTLHWIPTGTGQMIYFFFFTVDCNASLFQRMFRKCRLSQ